MGLLNLGYQQEQRRFVDRASIVDVAVFEGDYRYSSLHDPGEEGEHFQRLKATYPVYSLNQNHIPALDSSAIDGGKELP